MLEIGILKNFDSGTYKAGVQLAGSLTTYFDGISVAKNIPSAALVIGNYVIVAIPRGNPRDACVIATWPQGSSVGTHAGTHEWLGDDELDVGFLVPNYLRLWNRLSFLSSDWWTVVTSGTTNHYTYIHLDTLRARVDAGAWIAEYLKKPHYIDLSKAARRWRLAGLIQSRRSVADHITWWGLFTNPDTPTDTEDHIGIKIVNGELFASCGNGTNGNQESTGVTQSAYDESYVIIRTYSNKIEFYIDGVLTNTLTAYLPGTGPLTFSCYIKNNPAGGDHEVGFSPVETWVSPE